MFHNVSLAPILLTPQSCKRRLALINECVMDEPREQVCDLHRITLNGNWPGHSWNQGGGKNKAAADSKDLPESWRQKQENITMC